MAFLASIALLGEFKMPKNLALFEIHCFLTLTTGSIKPSAWSGIVCWLRAKLAGTIFSNLAKISFLFLIKMAFSNSGLF